jgi:hypothetical protein
MAAFHESVMFSHIVVTERVIAVKGLKLSRISAPERIPIRSEIITFFVMSARAIATTGGTTVSHPYSTSHRLAFQWMFHIRLVRFCLLYAHVYS